jgi:hypothetical protein
MTKQTKFSSPPYWRSAAACREEVSDAGRFAYWRAGLRIFLCTAFILGSPTILLSPVSQATTIYRWVSPNGTVSFGDHPPANARKLEVLPAAPPSSLPAPNLQAAIPAPSSPTDSASQGKALTAIERLNLLTALNNYQKSLQAPPQPQHHVYVPAYIGPEPNFPYPHRPRRWQHPPPPFWRPIPPPSNRPPTVLLPPPVPASAYSSPVLLP